MALGRVLGALGPFSSALERSWAPLVCLLNIPWALWGVSWAPLGPLPWKPPLLILGTVGHQFDVSPVWCEKVL